MTRRGEATRSRLLEATRAVVRQVGYAHASTRAIAAAAGVAEGTIYRHFPDKAQLFLAAAMAENEAEIGWLMALPERAGSGAVEDTLLDVVTHLARLRGSIGPLELAIASDPELSAQRQRALDGGALPPGPPAAIIAYLRAEQALGRVRADIDPVVATEVFLAALFGIAILPARGGRRRPGGSAIQALVRIYCSGIAVPAAGRDTGRGR